jgi:hypothetical protein
MGFLFEQKITTSRGVSKRNICPNKLSCPICQNSTKEICPNKLSFLEIKEILSSEQTSSFLSDLKLLSK